MCIRDRTYTGDGNPMADLIIDVTATDDVLVETSEDYTVSISNPGSTTGDATTLGGTTSVATTIADNDAAIWSITGDASVDEGDVAQYTVSLSGTLQTGSSAVVDINISDLDTNSPDYANFVAAVNAAVSGRSDLAFDGVTLTYTSDGTPMAPLTISLGTVDDAFAEGSVSYTHLTLPTIYSV